MGRNSVTSSGRATDCGSTSSGRGSPLPDRASGALLAGDETAIPAAAQLLEVLPARPTVVVAFDARYRSATFAEDVATVVAHAGGRALPIVDRAAREPVSDYVGGW